MRARTTSRTAGLLGLVSCLLVSAVFVAAPAAEASPAEAESTLVSSVNAERKSAGLATLSSSSALAATARQWSSSMAAKGSLSHNPDLASQAPSTWQRLGENVAYSRMTGASWTTLADRIHTALMASNGHRANILGDFNQVGIGVVLATDGTMWVTQVFMKSSAAQAWSAPSKEAVAVSGDWNGNGTSTPGWYDGGRFYLRNSNNAGAPDIVFAFGKAGDIPIVGDWNGDGVDTVGVIRDRTWHLKQSHAGGAADVSFVYGRLTQGDLALAGDWNATGRDTPGIVREGVWYLRNSLSGGAADVSFKYGRVLQGDIPLVGDWNGDGSDTPAIVRGRTWHIRLENRGGVADHTFDYGASGDVPIRGDWNASKADTPGVVRGDMRYLRNSLSGGAAHLTFRY